MSPGRWIFSASSARTLMIFSAKVSESSFRMSWRNDVLKRGEKLVAIKRERRTETVISSQEPATLSSSKNLKVFESELTHNSRPNTCFWESCEVWFRGNAYLRGRKQSLSSRCKRR